MTRPAVWEPRGETEAEVVPEWEVAWWRSDPEAGEVTGTYVTTHAPHAWDAWLKVHGAPAFGSCRVRRVVE